MTDPYQRQYAEHDALVEFFEFFDANYPDWQDRSDDPERFVSEVDFAA